MKTEEAEELLFNEVLHLEAEELNETPKAEVLEEKDFFLESYERLDDEQRKMRRVRRGNYNTNDNVNAADQRGDLTAADYAAPKIPEMAKPGGYRDRTAGHVSYKRKWEAEASRGYMGFDTALFHDHGPAKKDDVHIVRHEAIKNAPREHKEIFHSDGHFHPDGMYHAPAHRHEHKQNDNCGCGNIYSGKTPMTLFIPRAA